MPRHVTLSSLAAGWTQATDADVTAIRIQHNGAFQIQVQRGSNSEPASLAGAITVNPGQIVPADVLIADMWPGVSGSRVWIWSDLQQGGVSISHA